MDNRTQRILGSLLIYIILCGITGTGVSVFSLALVVIILAMLIS